MKWRKKAMDYAKESLKMHYELRGKLEVTSRAAVDTKDALSLAYTPGVAAPCLEIQKDVNKSYELTRRWNTVAVVTDGTAVLGLGDIGPEAGMPVMEGKCVLFKEFGGVDAIPLCVRSKDVDDIVNTVRLLAGSFGGVNLEDISAPRCFEIEKKLKECCDIPIFHDDQHGTAVISGAALLNAAELTGRKLEDMKVVVVGAGAAGISCAKFYMTLGVRREHIYMFDSKGLIHTGRIDLHATKAQFSQSEDCSLEEALTGADVFLGLSTKGLLTQDMVKLMAPSPIIFACANPDPEITYQDAKKARPDCIMGSGRSDWPNQVNNVSCFPFIFRAALDVRASVINEQMKIAAARSLADLAKEPVPQEVIDLYGGAPLSFGIDYVIPKPIDPRIIEWECPAVAQAAMISGVAQSPIRDMEAYTLELRKRIAAARERVAGVVRSYL